MANPQAASSVALDSFLGLVTNFAQESLPMGASPLNWDVDYIAGSVFTRAGLISEYTFAPAIVSIQVVGIQGQEHEFTSIATLASVAGLSVGNQFTISGNSNPFFNGHPFVIQIINATTSQITFTTSAMDEGGTGGTLTVAGTPVTESNLLYVKTLELSSGTLYTLALDAEGVLWSSTEPELFSMAEIASVIAGSAMFSATQDDVEYMCFSNYLNGTDIPRQYNPQPAIGAYTLDRISQVGPGAPPTFQATQTLSSSQVTITSWAGSGSIVTFQATNTFTAGEVISLSGFNFSTFFNGLTLDVLGTGLSGSQFQVSFSGYSGSTDTGLATPQYGYPIATIQQNLPQIFDGQTILWSAGPGQTTAGTTITCYYPLPLPGYQALINAFNSGQAVYVYIQNAPFGNGTQLVTGIGTGQPPSQTGVLPFFTFAATSSNYQISGNPPNHGGNNGTFQMTVATVTVITPIPDLNAGDQITIQGATPSNWDQTWAITNALNSGVYAITGTQMTNGTAVYNWQWAGSGTAIAPTPGFLVSVIQTLNGNGIFNVIDGAISAVTGGPNAGTFSIANLGTATQTIPEVAEEGQAQTSGTGFQIDPGQTTLGTQTNPIFGGSSTGIVIIAGANTAIGQGTRQAVCFFETRNGLKTACSAPVTFTTDEASTYLFASNVPIGPPNVIRRWIAFTSAGPNGIAGPNFYTIDAPVTYTINNQTYRYSATYIDDNVSTSAKFTFTDAVLLAGEEIDVQGNNLFAQIELGSSAWNIAYAQRMFYGLEQNKVLNFNNLSFDGGYIPGTGTPNVPLGWGIDPLSNSFGNTVVDITGFRIFRNDEGNFVQIFGTNSLTIGLQVVIAGLSVGTYLNGLVLNVNGVNPSYFLAFCTFASVPLTADSGTATVVGIGGAQLVASPVFGNALYISNQSGETQSVLGMIFQNAYQDAYNVPIILPNTLYSVRVTCSNPSGNQAGELVIDLADSNAGQVSGTAIVGGYGGVYGQYELPFSGMTQTMAIYSGTLLTTPFTSGVSANLILRVLAANIGYGADVLVDRIEIYPTATPLNATQIRVSYADNFEAFDSNTGVLGLAAHNIQPCYGAFEMHDQLYFLQSKSMQSTQDVPGVEPNAPGGGWAVHEVSNRAGACGIHAYDYGEEWVLTACRNGVYGFNGGQPIRIDFQQRELWELINWNYGQTIWLANDLPNSRILVGVPMPTPNQWLPFAPANPAPTSPNVVLMWNYQNLDTFEEIVSGRGVHTTMFGTLAAVDMRLKCSIWQIISPYTGFVTAPDGASEPLTICNGVGNQKIYQMSQAQKSDDDVAINGFYATFGFTDAAKAKENPLLGLHRKLYSFSQQDIYGAGTATLTAYPNWILNQDPNSANFLQFNPYQYSTPGGIILQQAPPDDIVRPLNVEGNRVFLSYQTNAVGAYFRLSKILLVGIMHPFAQVNPNSG